MEGLDIPVPDGYQLKMLTPADDFDPPITLMIVAVVIASIVVPCAIQIFFGPPLSQRSGLLHRWKDRMALVVAHPDDEAVFFWPTLLQLHASGIELCVLCLSTGNADGLGQTRSQEMQRSCASLGISGDNLQIVDATELQDGFHPWPVEIVADYVTRFVQHRQAKLVLTFDARGVSGHPNHISTCLGVRHAHDSAIRSTGGISFQVLELESIGLPTKYIGPLTLLSPDSMKLGNAGTSDACCTCTNPMACLKALAVHWTQLVWYRVLFTTFSRYAYVNTFMRYDPPDNVKGTNIDAPSQTCMQPRAEKHEANGNKEISRRRHG